MFHHRSGKSAEITGGRENARVASYTSHYVCAFIMNNTAQQSTPPRINLRWNNAS
jgi:hypothetical protein